MKKLFILLATLVFFSSCVKVIIEPSWGGNQEEKGDETSQEVPHRNQVSLYID